MPTNTPAKPQVSRVAYWDSCVLLSYIEDDPERVPDLEVLLEQGRRGELQILTSVATLVEVAFTVDEKTSGALDPVAEEKIEALWIPPSPVKKVEFHQLIASKARELVRDAMVNGRSLKPYDAIHLASALFMNVDELHTYDDKLLKLAPCFPFVIERPQAIQPTLGLPPAGAADSQ